MIQHYISGIVQQINILFPDLPPPLFVLLMVFIIFILLVVVLLLLRLVWTIVTFPLRLGRRRRSPQRLRYTPYRMYSSDWISRERERRRREFTRRIRR